ncbi:MAG: hypothetical protein M5U19_08600 [Microthrixaceae bacterium]|nr:hypothetical protein [Microthrixaceae bacterium]
MEESRTLSQATARSRGLRARRALGADSRSAASDAIASALVELPGFATVRTVAGYWPNTDEVDLVALWRHLVASGVHVVPASDRSSGDHVDGLRALGSNREHDHEPLRHP